MNCYCVDNEKEFVFCVENAEREYEKNIKDAWFEKVGDKYIKTYPNTIDDKERLKENFSRLGEAMFKGSGDWEKALEIFTKKGYTLKVEPLQERYKIELQRDRKDRIKAIEEYLGQAKGLTDIDGL